MRRHVKPLLATCLWLTLAACGSAPKIPEPVVRQQALEAEAEGARRHSRGEWALALRRFDEAGRLFTSIDDAEGSTRNRLHAARVELSLDRPDAALQRTAVTGTASLEALLVETQALLALQRDASVPLMAAATRCIGSCPQAGSITLLQARVAMSKGQAATAVTLVKQTLPGLRAKPEPVELANALRILGSALLASGDANRALPAASEALEIDRRLALPAKIASDWMLIGDIRRALKVGAGGTANDTAQAAYARALDIAIAANLGDIQLAARAALAQLKTQ